MSNVNPNRPNPNQPQQGQRPGQADPNREGQRASNPQRPEQREESR